MISILFFLYIQPVLADVSLECESARSIKLISDSQEFRFTVSNQSRIFRYSHRPDQQLIFNSQTGQYFLENSQGHRQLIVNNDFGEPSIRSNQSPRREILQPISTPLARALEVMSSFGSENLAENVRECANHPSLREQLRTPLTDLEVSKCRHDLRLLNRITRCFDQNNCANVVEDLGNIRASTPRYSFVGTFNRGLSVTDPVARIGTPMVIDSVVSNVGVNLMLFKQAEIGALAARVGLRFWSLFGLVHALSATTKPIILAVMYDDQCGSEALNQSQGRSIEDCVGRSGNSLLNVFKKDIEQAIVNPEQFLREIDQASNGLSGRLACYAIETQMNQWRGRVAEYQSFQCQGRTITTRNGHNYIIGENNSFYRHENMDRTFHFTANEPMQIENRRTGVRTTPMPVDEVQTPQVDSERIIPMRIVYEETMVAALIPQFLNSIENGQCREQDESPQEEAPTSQ